MQYGWHSPPSLGKPCLDVDLGKARKRVCVGWARWAVIGLEEHHRLLLRQGRGGATFLAAAPLTDKDHDGCCILKRTRKGYYFL